MNTLIGAWLDVRSKPLRTLAAIAGMVAAVIAVVVVDAAGILSRNANNEYLVRTYGRPATWNINITTAQSPTAAADSAARLTARLAANGITRVSTDVEVPMTVTRGSIATRANGMWVSSTYPKVGVLELVAGQFPRATARSDVLHVVITTRLAQQLLFTGADAVGQTLGYVLSSDPTLDLRTTPQQRLVIDAVAEPSPLGFQTGDIMLVSDLDRPDLLAAHRQRSWLVQVDPVDSGLVTNLVLGIRAAGSEDPVFQLFRIDQGANLAPVLSQQRVTARAVTWVALIVGGLGIFGVGVASVRERAQEFGLQRALGASKSRVFGGVMTQALLEVLLAAGIAIPLSAIVVELFTRRLVLATLPLPNSTALPVSSALRGLVAALAVGLIAGLLPAVRAARASVIQALRG